MKYENARLTQMLAAEYVLGTLVGRARHRFERLLQARADLRRELQFWEARFAPLLASSKPIPPREIVWAEIEARINHPTDRKSTRLNSRHSCAARIPSSA